MEAEAGRRKAVLLVLVALAGLAPVRGLYFHISETEQRCFIEEVPAETMIVGTHVVPNRAHLHVSCIQVSTDDCVHVRTCGRGFFYHTVCVVEHCDIELCVGIYSGTSEYRTH